MTITEAKEIIKIHGFKHEDLDNPKMEKGFLGMLKPYRGELYEENYNEIITAIKVLSSETSKGESVQKEIMEDILSICYYANFWGLDKDGMLRRNGLLPDQDIDKLQQWIQGIIKELIIALDGDEADTLKELE
jgi:hypothetical protein